MSRYDIDCCLACPHSDYIYTEEGFPYVECLWCSKILKAVPEYDIHAGCPFLSAPRGGMMKKMTRKVKILLVKLLYRRGWSKVRIAKFVGVSRQTIYNWLQEE